jgi:antitoxin PrlF
VIKVLKEKHASPTERGQVTIPKSVRDKLGITSKTKLKIYTDNNKIIIEPVPLLDLLLKDIEDEAKSKGYTREELEQEIEVVREKLINDLYK